MDTLEQEIVEKFKRLDKAAQARVKQLIDLTTSETSAFDFEEWLAEVTHLQADIQQRAGASYVVGGQDLLDDLREERS